MENKTKKKFKGHDKGFKTVPTDKEIMLSFYDDELVEIKSGKYAGQKAYLVEHSTERNRAVIEFRNRTSHIDAKGKRHFQRETVQLDTLNPIANKFE